MLYRVEPPHGNSWINGLILRFFDIVPNTIPNVANFLCNDFVVILYIVLGIFFNTILEFAY